MLPSSERCSTHLRVTLLGTREPTLSLPWIDGSYMTQVINSMIDLRKLKETWIKQPVQGFTTAVCYCHVAVSLPFQGVSHQSS